MNLPGKLVPEALKTLGKKRATVTYPKETRELPDRFRGALEFDEDLCTGCMMCDRQCAANAITVKNGPEGKIGWSYDVARCMFCGQCEEACPVDALTMSNEFELASGEKAEFTESYIFER